MLRVRRKAWMSFNLLMVFFFLAVFLSACGSEPQESRKPARPPEKVQPQKALDTEKKKEIPPAVTPPIPAEPAPEEAKEPSYPFIVHGGKTFSDQKCQFEFPASAANVSWEQFPKKYIKEFNVEKPTQEDLKKYTRQVILEGWDTTHQLHVFKVPQEDLIYAPLKGFHYYRVNQISLEAIQPAFEVRSRYYYDNSEDSVWARKKVNGAITTDCPGEKYDFILQSAEPLEWKTRSISAPDRDRLNERLAKEDIYYLAWDPAPEEPQEPPSCRQSTVGGLEIEAVNLNKKWLVLSPHVEPSDCEWGNDNLLIYESDTLKQVGKVTAFYWD